MTPQLPAALGQQGRERVRDDVIGHRHLIQYVDLFDELIAVDPVVDDQVRVCDVERLRAVSAVAGDSVRYACAIVRPYGPLFARAGSVWIHCLSCVAAPNAFTWAWVTVCQALWPRTRPTKAGSSAVVTRTGEGTETAVMSASRPQARS